MPDLTSLSVNHRKKSHQLHVEQMQKAFYQLCSQWKTTHTLKHMDTLHK